MPEVTGSLVEDSQRHLSAFLLLSLAVLVSVIWLELTGSVYLNSVCVLLKLLFRVVHVTWERKKLDLHLP